MSLWSSASVRPSQENGSAVPDGECQAESYGGASSSKVSHLVDLIERTREQLRRHGIVATFRKVSHFLARTFRSQRSSPPGAHTRQLADEVLNLQPGELVEVKSAEEIAVTLDEAGTLKGLVFLPAMTQFCGKRFVVRKRLERMYQEESRTLRRLKNTVLLDRAMCDGLLMRCDRCCFFYWREAWLRRIVDD